MSARTAAGFPAETEAGFQQALIELAQRRGWLVAHFRPARTNGGWKTPVQGDAGFVDVVLVRPPRIIFAELKSSRGRLSREQETWIARLAQSGGDQVEAYVWRPEDWTHIEEALAP